MIAWIEIPYPNMPRKLRFYLPGVPTHVMQRGHNRNPVFFAKKDYLEYLKILKKVADQHECKIHAYVLMTNHIHLLLTPTTKNGISLLFQSLGRTYVNYINKTYQRSGTLWEGRHKGNIIDSETYLLTCMQYIELNPVRAGMTEHPSDYPWSSYHANGMGESNVILSPHELYLSLAKMKDERLQIYNELLDTKIKSQELLAINKSVNSGTPLGSTKFIKTVETKFNCSIGHISQGRPVK